MRSDLCKVDGLLKADVCKNTLNLFSGQLHCA